MSHLQIVSAANEVRWWLDHSRPRHEPLEAKEIKKFFLFRWPDIRASEVILICKLVAKGLA